MPFPPISRLDELAIYVKGLGAVLDAPAVISFFPPHRAFQRFIVDSPKCQPVLTISSSS